MSSDLPVLIQKHTIDNFGYNIIPIDKLLKLHIVRCVYNTIIVTRMRKEGRTSHVEMCLDDKRNHIYQLSKHRSVIHSFNSTSQAPIMA